MRIWTKFGLCAVVSILAGCSGMAPHSNQLDISTSVAKTPSVPAKPLPPMATFAANEVTIKAIGFIGVKYVWGGIDPLKGFDCSGLVSHVFSESIDVKLPRTSMAMSAMKAPIVKRQNLKSGDLLFFATGRGKQVSHVAIYLGKNRFIHAPRTGKNVGIARLDNVYWSKRFVSAKRVITDQAIASLVKPKEGVKSI